MWVSQESHWWTSLRSGHEARPHVQTLHFPQTVLRRCLNLISAVGVLASLALPAFSYVCAAARSSALSPVSSHAFSRGSRNTPAAQPPGLGSEVCPRGRDFQEATSEPP